MNKFIFYDIDIVRFFLIKIFHQNHKFRKKAVRVISFSDYH
jgi:hypothetical protein